MSKNLLQDMVKIKTVAKTVKIKQADVSFRKKNGKSKYTLWGVAVVSIIFFLYSISFLFLRAVVTVNPKVQDLVLDKNLSADKSAGAETLPFDLIVISGEENKIMQATEEKDVSEKAKGVVVIYNAFSSAIQRLDIDTRLEGSNGKIYKTEKQIVVPGMKNGIPGSIEVGVYAAGAGEEYNTSPLDFTILGFKGTPKYSKFYARSKGSITGGFVGKTSVISNVEKSTVINDLKSILQAKLFKKAADQIPSGFILFKDAMIFNIDDDNFDNPTLSDDNMATINFKGTLYGFLFNEEKLTKKIAEENIDEYDGSAVYMPNIKDLTFSFINKADFSDAIDLTNVKSIDFNLKGMAKIVWKLDEVKLKEDLLNKPKKNFNQILSQYPNIDSASSSISPFWRMSFPNKTKNIKVIVDYLK